MIIINKQFCLFLDQRISCGYFFEAPHWIVIDFTEDVGTSFQMISDKVRLKPVCIHTKFDIKI